MERSGKLSTEERSWILYDVGNSVFVLVMVTALMPIFYKDFAASHLSGAISTAHWGFANSAASLVLALLSPLLGAMADYKMRKKYFFVALLCLGLIFTLSLSFIQQGQWLLCLILFVFARIGWAGANVLYDAFIIDVTSRERMDSISAKGYGFGYIGSVVPFAIIIAILYSAGIADGLPIEATKLGFIVVALWWGALSLPAIKHLKQRHYIEPSARPVADSFKRLYETMLEIKKHKQPFLFLAAYFFYIDGVGTIISMSTAYGRDLGFSITTLIAVILFIQIVAFPFTLVFGRLAAVFTTKTMLFVGIGIYVVITLLAFFLPSIEAPDLRIYAFWLVSFLVASAMGGIQALSRSFYGRLIPPEKSSEFFGFYNVFGKFAAITGPFLMGLVGGLTGHSRWGVLSLLFLFVIGAFFLTQVHDTPQSTTV
ncbi:MFS transporter [Desulforhopalus sp. IMCC35007]|uniref:MFS transporter n=1 Tax=Desulforhopalus sp. IMCC35007 TaxID=2569543 RepID=UPI0010ADDECE|nr:MFS transporter [Desulforhopalus sp. IMCC35007]TKB05809.1 MFS transporter [Desulforhopalus sp. IMCC35007]